MHKFSSKIKAITWLFLFRIKGSIALEIAMISPLFIVMILGILELSIIFSLRSGLEDIIREVGRIKLSVSGATAYGTKIGSSASEDELMTRLLHSKITRIVTKPENTQICSTIYDTTRDLADNIPSQARNCVQFSNDLNTPPSTLFLGDDGEFAKLEIVYRHEYLTPFGNILGSLGQDITFSTVTVYRKEVP